MRRLSLDNWTFLPGAWALSLICVLCMAQGAWAQSAPAGSFIENRVLVRYADANGNPMPDETATASTQVAAAPVLSIRKTPSSDPISTGAPLTWAIEYANTGNGPATGVQVQDFLPENVVFVTASGNGAFAPGPPGGGTVTWGLPDLPAGQGGALFVETRVKTPADYPPGDPAAIQAGDTIANTVRLTSAETSAGHTATVTVGQAPNLILTKFADIAVASPGGEISYRIAWANLGNAPAAAVTIHDDLPQDTEYMDGSASGNGVLSGRALSWDLGPVQAGDTGEVSFRARVSPMAADGRLIRNTATAILAEQGVLASNETVVRVSAQASLSLSKTVSPNPVLAGGDLTYLLRVENSGAVPLNNVSVSDPLPSGTSFLNADSGGLFDGQEVAWSVGALDPGQFRELRLVVSAASIAPGQVQILNTARALANGLPAVAALAAASINCRTGAAMSFLDASGNAATVFEAGDTVCVRVTDPDRNTDPATAEAVTVDLSVQATGDAETLALLEVDLQGNPATDTGIFQGCIPSVRGSASPGDNTLDVDSNSVIHAVYSDPLDPLCGLPAQTTADAAVSPRGVVFDTFSGQPVQGVFVTLFASDGRRASTLPGWTPGQPDMVTTGPDGTFHFGAPPFGDYYLAVDPGQDHRFPTAQPNNQMPPGKKVLIGSRGEVFSVNAQFPVLALDIPVDPRPGILAVTKTCGKARAAVGEILVYRVTVTNQGRAPVTRVRVEDVLFHGANYLKGSSSINGMGTPDPVQAGPGTLAWTLDGISAGQSAIITYRILLGPDSHLGDGKNTARATGASTGQTVSSNTASHKVRITQGVFTTDGTILGKVFLDCNGNGIQDPPDAGNVFRESGIPGVVLYTEQGIRVETDQNGKYSIPAVTPGTHVIRLDESSLPGALEPMPVSNRFMGDDRSQFVDVNPHGLMKANFGVRVKPGMAWGTPSLAGETGGAAARTDGEQAEKALPLEEKIKEMSPDLSFVFPSDGEAIGRDKINVAVKALMGSTLSLLVNGNPVPADRVGKRITHAAGRVEVQEYIAVELTPGQDNELRAVVTDAFGNERGSARITVRVSGGPEALDIRLEKDAIPADGRSQVEASVLVLDKDGRPVPSRGMVTVAMSQGRIISPDADPGTDGVQVPLEQGRAAIRFRPPTQPGRATLFAEAEGLQARKEIYFTPHLRDMMVVGEGEIVVGMGDARGDTQPLRQESAFGDGTYADGRGAVFAKGRLFEKTLLTAAYDSAKKEDRLEDDVFSSTERDPDDEDRYPIYGDESETEYQAQSRDRLYVKLEREKSSLLYGDFSTDYSGTRLSAYNRAFTGGLAQVEEGPFRLRAFAAKTDQAQVVDVIRGRGVSGYYHLSEGFIVEGSERVSIETRDRYQSDHVLSRELLARGQDYEVDYDLGAILFREPVPSHDEGFNPVYVVAQYESVSEDLNTHAYGGRGEVSPLSWLTLGATGVVEEHPLADRTITGADAALRLPLDTHLRAEYARTQSFFDVDGDMETQDGEGWRMELETSPWKRLRLDGYYQELSDFFDNPSATDAQRGTWSLGARAEADLYTGLSLSAGWQDGKDLLNDRESRRTTLMLKKDFKRASIQTGMVYENVDEGTPASLDPASPVDRPFDYYQGSLDQTVSVAVAADYSVTQRLSLEGSHQQSVSGTEHRLSGLGVNLALTDKTRGYLREEYATYPDREDLRTVLGIESQLAADTTAYNEMRLEDGASGNRNQQIMGLRHRFRINPELSGNASLEMANTLSGEAGQAAPDGFAATGALKYVPGDRLKVTTRLEFSLEDSQDATRRSYLGEAGLLYKLHPEYSLLVRSRGFFDDREEGDRTYSRTLLGLAYRPLQWDRFNALAKVEYKNDRDGSAEPDFDSESFIPSLEGVWQTDPRTQFIAKYACKFNREDGFDAFTDLWSGRIIRDLTGRLDAGAGYRIFTSHATGTVRQGGFVELGARVIKDLWLSGGYCFDDFDTDLTGDSFRGQGPYLKLRFKFDEDLFFGKKG